MRSCSWKLREFVAVTGMASKASNPSARMSGLKEQHLTPAAVKMWKKTDDQLTTTGFNNLTRSLLLEASETYGSLYNALTALLEHKGLVKIRQLKNVESAGLKEVQSKRLEKEASFNSHKEANMSLALIYFSGWNPTALQWAPEVLKRADTLQKRTAFSKHFNQLEWHDVGEGEMRLVKSDKAAFHDPVVIAKTLQELRSACNTSLPFNIARAIIEPRFLTGTRGVRVSSSTAL
jgi:hypothetical protein